MHFLGIVALGTLDHSIQTVAVLLSDAFQNYDFIRNGRATCTKYASSELITADKQAVLSIHRWFHLTKVQYIHTVEG